MARSSGINIPIKLDTKGASASIEALNKSIEKTLKSVETLNKKVTKSSKESTKATKEQRKELVKTNKSLGQYSKRLTITSKRLGTFASRQKQANKAIKGMKGSSAGLASVLTRFPPLMAGAFGAVAVTSVLRLGAELEGLQTRFEVLLGSEEKAVQRLKDLDKFSRKTPFQLKDLGDTSALLQNIGDGSLASAKGLRLIGDASIVAQRPIKDVAMWVGRAWDLLSDNQPVGEAVRSLTEMAVISAKTASSIRKLQEQGKGAEAWDLLQKALARSSGAMDKASETASGLWSTIKDLGGEAVRQGLAGGTWDLLKMVLKDVADTMTEWVDTGVFGKIGAGFGVISGVVRVAITAFKGFLGVLKFVGKEIGNAVFTWVNGLRNVGSAFKMLWDFIKGDASWQAVKMEFQNVGADIRDSFDIGLKESKGDFQTFVDDMHGLSGKLNKDLSVIGDSIRKAMSGDTSDGKTTMGGGITRATGGAPKKKGKKAKDDTSEQISRMKTIRDALVEMTFNSNNTIFELNELAGQQRIVQLQDELNERMILFKKYGMSTIELERQFAKKRQIIHRETAFANARATGKAGEMIIGDLKTVFGETKALAIAEATIKGIQATVNSYEFGTKLGGPVLGAFMGALSTTATSAQIAKISSQNFATGGFPTGQNANVTMNERGQESILNASATARLGRENINRINRGQDIKNEGGNNQPAPANVTYNPTINITGMNDSSAILSILDEEREKFGAMISDLTRRGYVTT